MKLFVLGGSGKCGQWVIRLACERGHAVTALIRPQASIREEGIEVIRGNVLDPGLLDEIVDGHDAVVSCIGIKRASINPWSKILSPPDLTKAVAQLLVSAMDRHRIKRLIMISAAGAGDSGPRSHWFIRKMIEAGSLGIAYRDLEEMEKVLSQSRLDWLAVRPVTLKDGGPTGSAKRVERYGLTSSITRGEVARWMLDAVEQKEAFSEHTVMIGA